jgi:hypothetical protein
MSTIFGGSCIREPLNLSMHAGVGYRSRPAPSEAWSGPSCEPSYVPNNQS